jgi:hypothetical protein
MVVLVLLMVGIIFAEEHQVEPFSAGEGRAIEIYNRLLPILEACESHFAENEEIGFEDIVGIAAEEEIDLDDAREAVLFDPNMTVYAIEELIGYSTNYYQLADEAEESKNALMSAAKMAERHARTLVKLVEEWAPDALPDEEE